MSTGLLLIFVFYVCLFLDCLSECYLRLAQFNLTLIFVQQSALDNLKLLLANTIYQRLSVLCVIDYLQSLILMRKLLKCLRYFINIALIRYFVAKCCIRLGYLKFTIFNDICLSRQCITGSCCCQFRNCTDIACMQFGYFNWLAALKYIELADFFLNILVLVIDHVIWLEYTRAHLNQRIFANKRIYNCLKYIG